MSYEWGLPIICAILWRIGGKYNKIVRRAGIPLSVFIAAIISLGWSWWYFPMVVGYWAATTLPFTFKGDSIPHNGWFNWAWPWILGYITSLPSLFIHFSGKAFLYPLITLTVFGLCTTLSNLKETRQVFKWHWCELLFGASVGLVAALSIGG